MGVCFPDELTPPHPSAKIPQILVLQSQVYPAHVKSIILTIMAELNVFYSQAILQAVYLPLCLYLDLKLSFNFMLNVKVTKQGRAEMKLTFSQTGILIITMKKYLVRCGQDETISSNIQ